MQPGTAVTLPGGALIGSRLEREAAFRPLTGRIEAQLAELACTGLPPPQRVSAMLATVLAHVGGHPASEKLAAGLNVSDRQFLVLAFALECGNDEQWRHVTCSRCQAKFDVGFRLSQLPVTPAGAGYPWAELCLAGRQVRVRLPTGDDEAGLAAMAPGPARRALALRCVVEIDGKSPDSELLDSFGEREIDAIDEALDAIAPQVATTLSATCTECGASQTMEFDVYQAFAFEAQPLYRDVHALASRYHWSEAQILRLPRERRRLYLDLIDRSNGMGH